ncbi:MAG: hypothetical protein CALGDGBN_00501 [Pseudomonadales bacterium]|nr:hypothetical protein [Pseudomonadales bacterium]
MPTELSTVSSPALPSPRIATDETRPPSCVIRLGVCSDSPSSVVMPFFCSEVAVSTVIEIGTSNTFSARRCAVTMISSSSRPEVSRASGAVGYSASASGPSAAAKRP